MHKTSFNINKKFSLVMMLLTAIVVFNSCDEFLDKDPYDRPATEIALSDIDGLNWAMNGTYDAMCAERYYGKLFVAISEYMGEDVKQKEDNGTYDTYGDVYRYTKNVEDNETERLWEYCYDVMLRVNNVIEFLPYSIDGTDDEKNKLMGQALFVRALTHFDLVRAYGQNFSYTADASHLGVPVVTWPLSVTEVLARETVKVVYDQIITDLKAAVDTFPEESFVAEDAKYGNKYAAIGLLSRVYMYMGDYVFDDSETGWTKCIEWSSRLLDDESSPFSLIPEESYVDSWATLTPSSESLFELAFVTSSSFNIGSFFFPGSNVEYAEAVPSYDLLQLYQPGDVRIGMFHVLSSTGEVYSKKYPGSDGQVGLDNVKVLRLSEIYLNRAEAYAQMNQLSEATDDLNMIRNRAGLDDLSEDYTQEDLLEEIYLERRRELAFEGHRIWDITRRHQDVVRTDLQESLSYAKITYPDPQFVLPIPEDEIQANINMIQNEDY